MTKSAASTPETASLNVRVKETVEAAVGLPSFRTMDSTTGAVLSIVKAGPATSPLPSPAPPKTFPASSPIESSSTRFNWSVPSPVPVDTVTT